MTDDDHPPMMGSVRLLAEDDRAHLSTGEQWDADPLPARVIPGNTGRVKTAISVPDATFDRVERLAKQLGVSRSEFFSRAAARWADELEASEVTAAIDRALEDAGDDDAAFIEAAARRMFSAQDP